MERETQTYREREREREIESQEREQVSEKVCVSMSLHEKLSVCAYEGENAIWKLHIWGQVQAIS